MAIAVIQARMASTRLPGKVLRPLAGRPVISWVIRAAKESGACSRVVVATSDHSSDDVLVAAAEDEAEVVRGPLDDVLSRFVLVLDRLGDDDVVRLTADCPLLDPSLIAMAGTAFASGDVDYLSTTHPRSLPRGLDVEICSAAALRIAAAEATGVDRVHVTSFLYRHPDRFRLAGLTFSPPADDLRVTLDTEDDARALEELVQVLGDRAPTWFAVVQTLRARPDIVALNADVRQKQIEDG